MLAYLFLGLFLAQAFASESGSGSVIDFRIEIAQQPDDACRVTAILTNPSSQTLLFR